jgi:SAM-dependent methyltransferase
MAWCVAQYGKRTLRSAIELAAGPGYHALELGRRGIVSHALDIEESMVGWLREKAGATVTVHRGDMRSFVLAPAVDLAYCLFASFCYLMSSHDVRAHFAAVHASLSPGGVYVIELPHPRKYLRHDTVTKDDWEMRRGDTLVRTRWDIDGAVPDPVTQIMDVRSEYEVTENGRRRKIRSRGRQRVFFAQELVALAEPHFELAAWYGAMDRSVKFDYGKKAWRMVAVLRRMA